MKLDNRRFLHNFKKTERCHVVGSVAKHKEKICAQSSVCPVVQVDWRAFTCEALLDSGSARSLVSVSLFNRLSDCGLILHYERVSVECWTASKERLPILPVAAKFRIKVDGLSWAWTFLVSPCLSVDCILGADFIAKCGLVLDIQGQCCYFKFRRDIRIPFAGVAAGNEQVSGMICEEPTLLEHLNPDQRQALGALCEGFPDVLTPKLGLTPLLKYRIRLNDTGPVRSHPYKFAPPKMEALRQKVNELLEQGVIEPSTSSYASPAFLVPKPDGKNRFVIDYRKVNKVIEVDSVPLPDLHSAFDWFHRAKYFTIFDLNAAYHQIPLEEDSKKITAFCVPWNLYQFTRVPMGLAVGAQTLTRLLDSILHDIKFQYVFNYLDDVLVYSETFEEHLLHLREVMTRFRRAKLTVNPEKVKFAHPEISFLGHRISHRGGVHRSGSHAGDKRLSTSQRCKGDCPLLRHGQLLQKIYTSSRGDGCSTE